MSNKSTRSNSLFWDVKALTLGNILRLLFRRELKERAVLMLPSTAVIRVSVFPLRYNWFPPDSLDDQHRTIHSTPLTGLYFSTSHSHP
jgi:hypothetical protein